MILVDTSIWIDHLHRGNSQLSALLADGEVACHPFVIGELACGNLKRRAEVLSLLDDLPVLSAIDPEEFLLFVDQNHLAGIGLGFVDVHLLASARLAAVTLWTADRRLRQAAARMQLAWG